MGDLEGNLYISGEKNYASHVSRWKFFGIAPSRIDRELFESDVRRVVKVGWLIIAGSVVVGIFTLPGGLQRWQITAVSILIVASIISLMLEKITHSSWAFALMPLTLLVLPLIYANNSQEPWIAYGLIVIPAIVHTTALENYRISLAIIYALTLLQYVVSKLNFSSISDNVDNQLLSSYFATSWSFIVGIGAIFIRRFYLKYYDAIEASVENVKAHQKSEAEKISNLNLQDHLNGQLHGTILNTLIAIRNSPKLFSQKDQIRKYISDDLKQLNEIEKISNKDFESLIRNEAGYPFHRVIDVKFDIAKNLHLDPLLYEVIREVVRELLLNTRKHSQATECIVRIALEERPLNNEITTSVTVKEISIILEDNSPQQVRINGGGDILTFHSESISRLLKSVEGEINTQSDSDRMRQEIRFRVPESHETHLKNVSTLRQDAIRFLSKGFISLTLLYAVVSFPAYLYLGLDGEITTLFLLQILLTLASIKVKKLTLPLAALGSITAISIFPVLSLKTLACQEIQYLPWLFNGILGSAFLVTLLVNSNLFKWLPIFSFLISSLIIQNKLPQECENLLDGSIPAIILIIFISIGFVIARNKSKRMQAVFFAESVSQYQDIQETKALVVKERMRIIQELRDFEHWLDSGEVKAPRIASEVNRLILCLGTFLLTSEYFNSSVVLALYRYSLDRNLSGLETRLEINTNDFDVEISRRELARLFGLLEKATARIPVEISVSRDELGQLSVTVKAQSVAEPVIFQKDKLRIQVIQDL